MKSLRTLLFAVAVAAQMLVPAVMIRHWESTLRNGEKFRFRAGPVDPYDAFRGRYVALRLEDDWVPPIAGVDVDRGMNLCAGITVGNDGVAHLSSGSLKPPAGKPYLNARVRYSYDNKVWLDLPIDRFYMTENLAPQAETAVRDHTSRTNLTTYVVVRVKDGSAVVEDVLIEDKPIREFLTENQDKK